MSDSLPAIDAGLARRLVQAQFPRWAHLPIEPVKESGWDNRTLRLGDQLSIRMPRAEWYAPQVDKEQRWLPVLAERLPLAIPTPVARGVPGDGYPYAWSVLRWLDGAPASTGTITNLRALAVALADFLVALRRIDTRGGPVPGPHNFWRGGPLTVYAGETLDAIEALGTRVPGQAARAVWDDAVRAPWQGSPEWVHGDVSAANLLVHRGRLAAVIDFGGLAVGDPACDLSIAWTKFAGPSRAAFRAMIGLDAETWARGRGWALWKALITLAGAPDGDPAAASARHVIDQVVADHHDDQARPSTDLAR